MSDTNDTTPNSAEQEEDLSSNFEKKYQHVLQRLNDLYHGRFLDEDAFAVAAFCLIAQNTFRNGSLQGAYFILAARAVGLDCGPMSGFDAAKVNAEFFPDGKWKVNFLCNLGYGDHSKLFPRSPRLEFEEACRVL